MAENLGARRSLTGCILLLCRAGVQYLRICACSGEVLVVSEHGALGKALSGGACRAQAPQPPMSQGFSGYALTNWLTRRQTSGTITVKPEMSPCLKDVGPFQGQTLPSTVTMAAPSEISTAMALQIVLKPYGPGRSLRDVASIATLEQRHRQPKVSGSAMCWKSCGTSCSARLKAWASRQIRVRVLCVLSAARELWHVQVVLVVRSGRSLLACSVFSTRVRTNSEASLSSGCRLQCTAGSSGTRRRTESIRPSRRKGRSSHSNVRMPRSLIGERVVTTTETKTPHHNKKYWHHDRKTISP